MLSDPLSWDLCRRAHIWYPAYTRPRADQCDSWDRSNEDDVGLFGIMHLCHMRHALYKDRCSVLAGMTFHWDNPYLSSIVRCPADIYNRSPGAHTHPHRIPGYGSPLLVVSDNIAHRHLRWGSLPGSSIRLDYFRAHGRRH